jgi:hypothetical protein
VSLRSVLVVASLSLATVTTVGCGGSPKVDPAPSTGQLLKNLKELLAEYQKQKNKAPSAITDFGELEYSFDGAMWLLRNNKVVYVWGAPLKADGQAVIAYVAEAPQSGGEVLLEDGTVKTMTAAEFAAAPKAAGKKA